jgi:diguanylate cyclase (GGDEF)-like protein
MSWILRKVTAGCAVLLGFGVVLGAGGYLASTQTAARQSALGAFDQRVRLASSFVGDTLLASDTKTREWASAAFGGPAAGLSNALTDALDSSTPWLVILDADGAPIGASAGSIGKPETLKADPGFRWALRSGKLAFGDVAMDNGSATVYAFQPYPVGRQTRVLVVPTTTASLDVLLHSALNVADSRAYVLDQSNRVVVSSTDATSGAVFSDGALSAEAGHRARGTVGDDYFVVEPVAGSDWRAIVVTSRGGLLSGIDSTARSGWLIFAAFAVAVLLILVIGASTLISSARLAHARQHDPLTGLPNRSLFLERTEAAVARWHRQENTAGCQVAALFLDLDGFKPVNDTYGHAAGDALLKAVARRLVTATRPEDYVCRFGGDEFLVLCRGLRDESDAVAIAERIKRDLSQPYDVLGRQVQVGTSIGIAALGEHAGTAEALINNADLALYRAKNNGRGIIERYVPEPQGVSSSAGSA